MKPVWATILCLGLLLLFIVGGASVIHYYTYRVDFDCLEIIATKYCEDNNYTYSFSNGAGFSCMGDLRIRNSEKFNFLPEEFEACIIKESGSWGKL